MCGLNRVWIVCSAQRQHQATRRIRDASEVELPPFGNATLGNNPEGIPQTAPDESVHDLECTVYDSRSERLRACCPDANDCLISNEEGMLDQFIEDLIYTKLIAPFRFSRHGASLVEILVSPLNVAVPALPGATDPEIDAQRAVGYTD